MKKNFKMLSLLAAMVLTFGTTSCSHDSDDTTPGNGEMATLNITVKGEESGSRATGDAPDDDRVVSNFAWFVSDGTNILDKGYSGTTSTTVTVPVSGSVIYTVANCGHNITGSFTSLADFNTKTFDILTQTPTNALPDNKRWASGKTTVTYNLNAQGQMEGHATVPVKFIAARIVVTVKNEMQNYAGGALQIKGITVLNAGAGSKLFGSDLVAPSPDTNKRFYSGILPTSSQSGWIWAAGQVTQNSEVYYNICEPAYHGEKKFYYYVGENHARIATEYPTIVAVVADYATTTRYFPVHLSQQESFKTGTVATEGVVRGKSYNIDITLKGDAGSGGGGGGSTTDPTQPIGATLDIDITVDNWIPVDLSKDFQ